MLLNLHYYRKDKFLTLDYMRCYFNLQIAFLGLEFCKPLCNGSAIAIKVFWRHCNVDRKEFGPAFSSVNFFDNSLERLCWTMFRIVGQCSEDNRLGFSCKKGIFSKIMQNLQENTSVSFLIKLQAIAFL